MTAALLIAVCGFLPHGNVPISQPCADAVQQLVCSSRETEHIRNDDPALILFKRRGYPLKDAKVDLAVERVNGCDSDAAAVAAPCEDMAVPKDQQARAESIAQPQGPSQ